MYLFFDTNNYIDSDPLKSWIEEQAAESGLAFRAARKKLEEAQNVSESSS